MSDYAGVVIFGGPMSANDCGSLAGIKNELEWIPKVVEAGVPYLGLCLGAQLLTAPQGAASHPIRTAKSKWAMSTSSPRPPAATGSKRR